MRRNTSIRTRLKASSKSSATPERAPVPASTESDHRLALRSRLAGVALVIVMLGLSTFAISSSHSTSNVARAADGASTLSDDYAEAARAVAAEESLVHSYRLDPRPEVRDRHTTESGALLGALELVTLHGDQQDRALVGTIRDTHRDYIEASYRLFAAVDTGDTQGAAQIDREETEVLFASIEEAVGSAANAQHAESQAQLAHLRQLETLTSQLTPAVFVMGLLLASLLAWISHVQRRLLDTERRRALHSSMHDALTGLPNRTLLLERLGQTLRTAREAGTSAGLLLIDVDRFKEINDTFGHEYGDELLTQIGRRLRSALPETDMVARLGGDEFAALLPNVSDLRESMTIAAKLRAVLESPFIVAGIALDVEASIGVVLSGEHGNDPTTLLQRADIAMYIAKAQNLGVFAYDPDLDRHSPAKLALLGELRRAVNLGQLVLYYQPKVSIGTGAVVGAEALVRWQHPQRGLIFPDEFIPFAESTGLIGPLTSHVLRTALIQARVWMDEGQPLMVSVNLSARNLLDERLPRQVADQLAAHGVPAELLELEVTESAMMAEPDRALRLLRALAALGVRLSIDDFGAGYTSLGQLKDLPVSELKIDKSFIMNMAKDPTDALIAHSIIDLGHSLGLTIVAEGVETAAALATLAAFNCDTAQGYYLSRPVGVAAFDDWRAAHTSTTAAAAAARGVAGRTRAGPSSQGAVHSGRTHRSHE